MRIIEAELLSKISPIYDSAERAIDDAKGAFCSNGAEFLLQESPSVCGVMYTDLCVRFLLSSAHVYEVYAEGTSIVSTLHSNIAVMAEVPETEDDSVIIRTARMDYTWPRYQTLQKAVGRHIVRAVAVKGLYYLYFKPAYILLFVLMSNTQTGDVFLKWDETD